MLLLLCNVGDSRYAIEGKGVVEVVPYVNLKHIPQTLEYVLGMMTYHAKPVLVIDFCQLIASRPCEKSMHSRIILLKDPKSLESTPLFGILAEKITETIDLEKELFVDTGIEFKGLPFLKGVIDEPNQTLQWISLEALIHFFKDSGVLHSKL